MTWINKHQETILVVMFVVFMAVNYIMGGVMV